MEDQAPAAETTQPRRWQKRLERVGGEGRGARFRNRQNGEHLGNGAQVTLGMLAQMPDWLNCDQVAQEQLASVVSILSHRPAIDRELSGTRLRSLAEAIGPALFDHICDAAIDDLDDSYFSRGMLPRPEDLVQHGRMIMYRALPKALTVTIPDSVGDITAAALVSRATAIIATMDMEVAA